MLFLGLATSALAEPAAAQEAPAADEGRLSVELNDMRASDRGCRFTFVVANGLPAPLSRAAFEIALFDTEGMVERLTLVDFEDLPSGKTKVRQFDFAGLDCGNVGRVLVNDATECAGDGIDPGACASRLATANRTDITFGT